MPVDGAWLELAAYALGATGAALLFLELFQSPSYVEYDTGRGSYRIHSLPDEVDEHTWLGRIGALLLAAAFLLLLAATLVG